MDRSPVTTDPFDDDKLKEECGIFGILGHKDAGALAALGLHALQHRGQEAAGIIAFDGRQFHTHRAVGLVGDNFGDQKVIAALKGDTAIGHVRYSTSGGTIMRNIQPLFAEFEFGGFGLAHNGNLTNAETLRRSLIKRGSIFQSTSDTEVIVHMMAQAQGDVTTRLIAALNQVEGAYSLTCIAKDKIIAVRDPRGVRPLVLGKLDGSWVVTSETCALDIIGADYVRDLEAGEMVVIDRNGIRSMKPFRPEVKRFCVFEYIYFARPDSVTEGISVYEARKRIGAELSRESGLPADLVVPVPDSGVPAALGYAQESGIPFDLGIIRNHYVGRTFIEPSDQIRHLGVKLKHNANRAGLAGKRVILVDDSIVRGTTSKKIVEMVRQAGATEVHMRISSPPTKHSCFYGIDTPESSQLLASKNDVAAMARIIGVDSLAFISIDGLYRAMGEPGRDPKAPRFCDACFTGEYPTRLTDIEERGDNPVQASLLEIA
ncbi:MAG: amidophosphoribosyltransferase [Rhodospirillales bacterium]|nr:amidophosphoribosyltransferase [Rhodospirillales bacterium]